MPTKTRVLVDTNVFVYAYDKSSAYHQRAVTFLSNSSFDCYTSTKNVAEFFAVLSKMNEPFPKVWQFYQSIRANCALLFPTRLSLSIFETLLQKYQPKGNRVFDIEVVSIAVANGLPEVETVNVKDFMGVTEIEVRTL